MSKKKPVVAKKADKTESPVNKRKLPLKEIPNQNGPPQLKKQKKSQEKPQQNGKSKLPESEDNQMEIEEDTATAQAEKRLDSSSINKAIFAIFNRMQDTSKQSTQKHINEMVALLTREKSANKLSATCAYALKRLVRCTGADDKESVALNAGYINAILREVPGLDLIELLELLKRELHVGSQQRGKDDSLAAVGQLITVFAIMQSQYFQEPTTDLIAAVYPILVSQLKGREYLVALCADIMAESFKKVSAAAFRAHVWPLLQPELSKPLSAQTLHGCDLLLAVHLHYPEVLSLRQLQALLWRKEAQLEQLFELYLSSSSSVQGEGEGVYARLGRFVASGGAEVLAAWERHLVERLPLKQSHAKCYVLQTLAHLLLHCTDEQQQQLGDLFSRQSLLQLLLEELRAAKRLSVAKAKPVQRQLRTACRRLETSLLVCFKLQLKEDAGKLAVLRPLLQQQLQLDSVVQTPRLTQQLLGQLAAPGLEQIYDFYRAQFTSEDSERVTRTQREHCLRQMQQLQLQLPRSQRPEQLQFLLSAAIFHLDVERRPCGVEQAALFSRQAAARCEESLLGCLVEGIGSQPEQLAAFNEQLRPLLLQLGKQLAKPGIEHTLRMRRTPQIQQLWRQVEAIVSGKEKDKKQTLAGAFDALTMVLGLAMLMPSCSVSLELLNDLFICKENALKAKPGKNKQPKASPDSEPKWQDVLTDVLLQLLLQTGHFWRTFVNAIGAALMPHLTKDNLEQLLDMLDISKNPLADKDWELDNGTGVEDEEEATSEEDEDEEEEEEDTDQEEDEDADADDDELTNMDLIREQVRLALLSNDSKDDDLDASSVDWNDVDEEQGERLNQALERAFQAHKPKRSSSGGGGGGAKSKRLTKSERITSTALLHFRVRVLDLVELFVSAQPQLEVLLDALICVHQVFQLASSKDNKLQPLAEAAKKTLRKLLSQKITEQSADKTMIIDCIQQLISQEQQPEQPEGVAPPPRPKVRGELAVWRNKCIGHLVGLFGEPQLKATPVWPLLQDYLRDWATRRNTPIQLATFDAILSTPWSGTAQFTASFYELLSSPTCTLRLHRRVQILELLLKHCRRLGHSLANDDDKREILERFHGMLAKYAPVADKDRNLQRKLLAQLQKIM